MKIKKFLQPLALIWGILTFLIGAIIIISICLFNLISG